MFRAMRGMQGTSEKVRVERFRSLSVRMGVAGTLITNGGDETVIPVGLIRGKSN
jgi:hypothetical protein